MRALILVALVVLAACDVSPEITPVDSSDAGTQSVVQPQVITQGGIGGIGNGVVPSTNWCVGEARLCLNWCHVIYNWCWLCEVTCRQQCNNDFNVCTLTP